MEAFPQGRTILSQCTDDALVIHLQPINTVVVANATELPPVIVTLTAGLLTTWTAVHSESESASGAKTATEEEKRAARTALQAQLFLNLIKLMELFPNQPQKLPLYMQQHLLEDHPAADEEEEEVEPAPEI